MCIRDRYHRLFEVTQWMDGFIFRADYSKCLLLSLPLPEKLRVPRPSLIVIYQTYLFIQINKMATLTAAFVVWNCRMVDWGGGAQWRTQRYWLEGRIDRTQRGRLWEGAVPLPRKCLNFKSKNGAFCALLSIDFNIYRFWSQKQFLTTLERRWQIVYIFLPFFRPSEARTRKYCDSGYIIKQPFFIHFITGLLKALQLIYWNGRTGLRVREGRKKSS